MHHQPATQSRHDPQFRLQLVELVYRVVDCKYNRAMFPELIGRSFIEAPMFAVVEEVVS